MFSFIRKYAESISGVDLYPQIAFILFLIVFAGMLWFVLRADKNYISELERIPLDDSPNQ